MFITGRSVDDLSVIAAPRSFLESERHQRSLDDKILDHGFVNFSSYYLSHYETEFLGSDKSFAAKPNANQCVDCINLASFIAKQNRFVGQYLSSLNSATLISILDLFDNLHRLTPTLFFGPPSQT